MVILKNACIIVDNVDNTGKRLIYNEKLLTHSVDYAVSIQTKQGLNQHKTGLISTLNELDIT